MAHTIVIGLNHIACPYMDFQELTAFAASCDIWAIEVRNDMVGSPDPFSGLPPDEVKRIARAADVRICTLNAFGSFNDVRRLDARLKELDLLLMRLHKTGTEALILCPVNDVNDTRNEDEAFADTVEALSSFGPLFTAHSIKGFVEPLGFAVSSLRTKRMAWEAVEASGHVDAFALVHDTFHHYLAGEQEFFPEQTGLVHLSGVEERIPMNEITDDHRVFISSNDRTGAAEQASELNRMGYRGIMSWEPFSSRIQRLDRESLKRTLEESIARIAKA